MKQIYNISDEDAKFIEHAYSLINGCKYPSFAKVTEVYNRVFERNVKNTSCGSCIRQRVIELNNYLEKSKTTSIHNDNLLIEDEKKSDLSLNENGSTVKGKVDIVAKDDGEVSQNQDIREVKSDGEKA